MCLVDFRKSKAACQLNSVARENPADEAGHRQGSVARATVGRRVALALTMNEMGTTSGVREQEGTLHLRGSLWLPVENGQDGWKGGEWETQYDDTWTRQGWWKWQEVESGALIYLKPEARGLYIDCCGLREKDSS